MATDAETIVANATARMVDRSKMADVTEVEVDGTRTKHDDRNAIAMLNWANQRTSAGKITRRRLARRSSL